ncbi:hypothetical protein YC2023_066012 [Brassica napus]
MGDQDKEKSMQNPDVFHKVCDGPWLHQTERTVHATAPRLCSAGKSKSGKSRRSKRTAGQSSQVAVDGSNLSGLQTDPAAANIGDVLPTDPANLTGRQWDGQEHQESDEEVESSNANRDGDQREKVADGTTNATATLSKEDLLEAIKVMGTQVVAMAQLFTPLVNSSVGQATPVATTAPNTNGPVVETVEVIEIDPPERTEKKVDYLSLLQHISRLGTKHFSGSTDPIEADEWRSRLFNRKYFPAEAWDRLEGRFLDLTQGRRAVREYEEEFNRLRQFVGRELEDETVQVRRFIRGLRPELRTHCSICTFSTVGELVERVALLESNLAEEAKLKTKSQSVPTGKTNDRKRKWDQVDGGKASSGRPECPKCGKNHPGECWKAMGACVRCGSLDHSIRDCTRPSRTQGQSSGSGSRTCFHCGQSGHFQSECPKRQGGQGKGRGDMGKSTQSRPTTTPRVYELSRDDDASGSFDSISGNF